MPEAHSKSATSDNKATKTERYFSFRYKLPHCRSQNLQTYQYDIEREIIQSARPMQNKKPPQILIDGGTKNRRDYMGELML
ncbi:hypothetical protein JHU04_001799 [Brenneria sp. 4F2]|nr:hypothetical protein [Brenneria bubanii]